VSAVLAMWHAAVILAIKEYKNEKLKIYNTCGTILRFTWV